MKQYLELLRDILDNGVDKDDRTNTGTISVFGRQLRFNMKDGFPAVTTKKLMWRSVVSELLWFLEGSTNEHRLAEIKNDNKPYGELSYKEKHTIWTDNYDNQARALGYKDGELGPIYGYQWRKFISAREIIDPLDESVYANVYYDVKIIDQIQNTIDEIRENPTSRRLVVSSWNAGMIPYMSLPPCHYSFQFYVNKNRLSLMCNMRSNDVFLGCPFNIASYALLLHIIAKITNKVPDELIISLGDVHIYKNHIQQVKEQLARKPHKLPKLKLPNANYSSIDNFVKTVRVSDFILEDYVCDDAIKAPMAI